MTMDRSIKTLGERVRERRRRLGMTQEAAAAAANIDLSYWSQLENARWENPGLATIRKVANVLHTSVAYLIGDIDDPRPILEPGQAAHDRESVHEVREFTEEDLLDLERAFLRMQQRRAERLRKSANQDKHN